MRSNNYKIMFVLLLMIMLPIAGMAQDSITFKKPHRSAFLAVSFSAVFPGGGQLYTQNYLKAAGFGGALGYLGYNWYKANRDYMNSVIGSTEEEAFYQRRRKYMLWTIGVWLGSLADAYVDAHLYKFNYYSEPRISLAIGQNSLGLAGRF
jgi:uncharacterized BrkB/YihY/UPF0761 family membrane protein